MERVRSWIANRRGLAQANQEPKAPNSVSIFLLKHQHSAWTGHRLFRLSYNRPRLRVFPINR